MASMPTNASAELRRAQQLQHFKDVNATMNITGYERTWLSKDDFRTVCNEIGDNIRKSYATEWYAEDLIAMIKQTLENENLEPPEDLGSEGHKYYPQKSQRALFKLDCKRKYRLNRERKPCTIEKTAEGERLIPMIPRNKAYDIICRAHIIYENGVEVHQSRDKTFEALKNLAKGAASKSQVAEVLTKCTHPACMQNHQVGRNRAKRGHEDLRDSSSEPLLKKLKVSPGVIPPPKPLAVKHYSQQDYQYSMLPPNPLPVQHHFQQDQLYSQVQNDQIQNQHSQVQYDQIQNQLGENQQNQLYSQVQYDQIQNQPGENQYDQIRSYVQNLGNNKGLGVYPTPIPSPENRNGYGESYDYNLVNPSFNNNTTAYHYPTENLDLSCGGDIQC